jgi:hypothetical protein
MTTDYIFNILDIYVNERPCTISELRGANIEEDFSTDEIDPGLVGYWTHCPRDCYNCKRCENELQRILASHSNERDE